MMILLIAILPMVAVAVVAVAVLVARDLRKLLRDW